MNVQTHVQTSCFNGGLPVKNRKMSVKHIPRESAIFSPFAGKIRSFSANDLRTLGKIGLALLIANEIRGLIMAAPLLVAMYHTGGSLMQAWLLLCVAVSVVVPVVMWRKING